MNIRNTPEIIDQASKWFSSRRGIPFLEYKSSMEESFNNDVVPTRIIVLNKGKIEERGKYNELIEKEGIFKDMYYGKLK